MTRRALPTSVRSIESGRPTLTVVLTPIRALMRCCSDAGHRGAVGLGVPRQQLAQHLHLVEQASARDHQLVLAR